MDDTSDFPADWELPRARLGLLLEHFSRLDDDREPWRVMYPLSEVLLLLTCATIASCDDFDDIAAWGRHHLDFLRRFAPFHFVPPSRKALGGYAPRGGVILGESRRSARNIIGAGEVTHGSPLRRRQTFGATAPLARRPRRTRGSATVRPLTTSLLSVQMRSRFETNLSRRT